MSENFNNEINKLLFAIAESDLDKFKEVVSNGGCELDEIKQTVSDGILLVSIVYWKGLIQTSPSFKTRWYNGKKV